MNSGNKKHEINRLQPGGNGYFRLKSTLRILENEQNWGGLKKSAEDMVTLYPAAEIGWYSLGLALIKLKYNEEALIQLEKALYLNPDMASANVQMGIAYYNLRNFNKAVYHFQTAIAKGLDSHVLYYNLGNACLRLNLRQAAIEAYTASLRKCENYHKAAYALFNLYFKNAQYTEALSFLKPIIDPNKLPNYLLAQAKLFYQNNPDVSRYHLLEAHRLLSCAINIDAAYGQAYYERAYVNSKLDDMVGFHRDRNTAFVLNPELRAIHATGTYR